MKRKKRAYDTLYRLKKQGSIKEISKNGRHFLKLTSKGQLELLIQKAGIEKNSDWDGQWRILIFDIPEDCNAKRDSLRRLLKRNNFIKLQASVFISPLILVPVGKSHFCNISFIIPCKPMERPSSGEYILVMPYFCSSSISVGRIVPPPPPKIFI